MASPGTPTSKTALLILAAINSLLLFLTLFVGGREAAFVFHASKAAAIFKGAVAHSGGNHGGTFLYPRFRFSTGDGQTVEFTSRFGSTDQPYRDGQTDFVLYDPREPNQAVLDHFWILWGGTVVLAMVTLILLTITWLLWANAGPDRQSR